MNRNLLALAYAGLALTVAGCTPDASVDTAVPAGPAAVTPTASAPVVSPVAAAAAAAPALDQKGFAGTFTGADSAITLNPDGSFILEAGQAKFDGSWTAEADGARIRLDPNSKTEPDRMFAVISQDGIRPIDVDGEPLAGGIPLQRETPPD